MSTKCVLNKSTMTGIADAIRSKGGTSAAMLPSAMPSAIAAIPTGAGWQKPSSWPDLHAILAAAPTVEGKPNKIAVLLDKTAAAWGYNVQSGEARYWFDGSTATTRTDIASESGATCWVVLYSSTAFTGRLVDPVASLMQFYNYKPILWVVGNNCNFTATRQQNLCNCNLLECVEGINFSIDNRMNGNGYSCFSNCRNLQKLNDCTISIYEGSSGSYYGQEFAECNSLLDVGSITFNGVTNFQSMFQHCYSLRKLKIENDTSCTFNQTFQTCQSLQYLDLPETTSRIENYCIITCPNLLKFVCRATTPPTVPATNAVQFVGASRIYVPYSDDHSILDAYKAATNWATYSSRMYELNADGTVPEIS